MINMLPTFVMNEICISSASGNEATTSQEPDRHTSPASPGSDIPQEWVSNLKDQRPRSNTARPKSDLCKVITLVFLQWDNKTQLVSKSYRNQYPIITTRKEKSL